MQCTVQHYTEVGSRKYWISILTTPGGVTPSNTHGGHEEGDPGHHDEHGGGEVDRENEGPQRPRQQDLEAVGAVVTCVGGHA